MVCPKCHMEQDDQNLLCDYCGIVFAKYHADVAGAVGQRVSAPITRDPSEDASVVVYAARPPIAEWLRERVFAVTTRSRIALGGRGALLVGLAIWGARLITTTVESNGVGESLLHLVNLPFHEAGHVFFTPFGDFVRVLGGTLGQLVMPMACCLVLLLKTRDPLGAGAALWWFGENFLDIAPYIDDAGTGELPLLGGNTGESTPYGFHDWEYLMTETGNLGKEHALAHASHVCGSLVMVVALAWMAWTLWREWRLTSGTRSDASRLAA